MLKKVIRYIGIGIVEISVIVVVSFYLVVVSGQYKSIQELWVTTAMTTFNHQWLATSFISEDVVNEIMERTKVDDAQYATDTSQLNFSIKDGFGDINQIWYKGNVIEDLASKGSRSLIDADETFRGIEQAKEDKKYEKQGYRKLNDGIYIKDTEGTGYKGYLLLVSDPSRVSLTQTDTQFECGQTVKQMVENSGAIVGINAGGFADGPNYDSNGGIPAGLLIINGEVINSGYREKSSVIGFNSKNMLVLGKMSQDEAIEAEIRDSVEFKPFLIVNGETVIKEGNGGWGIAPRTALGQRETGEVIFLCIDGRQVHSIGVDIRVLQDTLYEEGCINAAMVDGGSSTVMYHSEIGYLNKPSLGHERYINNCWVVK